MRNVIFVIEVILGSAGIACAAIGFLKSSPTLIGLGGVLEVISLKLTHDRVPLW